MKLKVKEEELETGRESGNSMEAADPAIQSSSTRLCPLPVLQRSVQLLSLLGPFLFLRLAYARNYNESQSTGDRCLIMVKRLIKPFHTRQENMNTTVCE